MTRDPDSKDLRLFDRRIVERNIRKGLITRKDYDKFLKSLEDGQVKVREPNEIERRESARPAASGGAAATPPDSDEL